MIRAIARAALRIYFAAHAPAEPAEWFEPTMPPRPRVRPYFCPDWSHEQKQQAEGLGDWISYDEADPMIVEWDDQRREEQRVEDAWNKDRTLARVLRWPWAWADAVLAARKVQP